VRLISLNKYIMPKKIYSELSIMVDLVSNEYQTSNPVIIAEKMYEDLGIEYTIHQIADYMDVTRVDFEKESNKVEFYETSRMS